MKTVKRKLLSAAAAATVLTSALAPGCALGQEVTVVLNGEKLALGAAPRIVDGTTLVPMREIFEKLGMEVSWNAGNNTVTAVKNGKSFVAQVGNKTVTVNGEAVEAGAAPALIDGKTFVPLRVIGDALGAEVTWDDSGVAAITKEEKVNDESWKENTGEIDLTKMSVSGEGLAVSGNVVEITAGGDFTVSGTSANAMIRVNTDSRVKLRLNGVNLTNPAGPAIFFENSDKGFVTIAKGTENYLADGAEYAVEAKGTLFSNDDLEIKGSGSLNVVSSFKHGIASDDEIKIEEGTINITAAGDGIHANDEVTVLGGSITIKAEGDGIQSEGFVDIGGGSIDITTTGEVDESADFGFGGMGGRWPRDLEQGDRRARPWGMQPEGGQAEGTEPQPPEGGMTRGAQPPDWGQEAGMQPQPPEQGTAEGAAPPDEMRPAGEIQPPQEEQPAETAASSKGIKAETNLIISGGEITVNSTDHCVHSAGIIFIKDGKMALTSEKKKGISAHSALIVEGGGINVLKATEGMESKLAFCINGGDISVKASDDGLNAGGTDGRDASEAAGHNLYINGGNIFVNAEGDGVDANGVIYFNGGSVTVSGPTNSGNGALDSGAGIVMNGGALLALGSAGMAEAPGGNSVQPSLSFTLASQPAGATVSVVNAEGRELVSLTSPKTFQNVIFSSPELELGGEYGVCVNGERAQSLTLETVSPAAGFGGRGFRGKQQRLAP